jgi:endonuclease/exonuclease/phosphatase family metal-dependent hydrolase
MVQRTSKSPNTFLLTFGIGLLTGIAGLWFLTRPQTGPQEADYTPSTTEIVNPVTAPQVTGPIAAPATDAPITIDVNPTPPPGAQPGVSIITWNIEWFPGQSPDATAQESRTHMAAVQEAVAEMDADIWLLQEMRDRPSVEELFMDLPHEVHVVSGHLYRGALGAMQSAIVSRFPAIDSGWENFVASDGSRAPPRGFSWAVLNIDGDPLIALTTHLKANPGNPFWNIRLREESARQMLAHIEELSARFPGAPVVVGGDFNLLLNQERMAHERTLAKFLEAGFVDGWAGVPFGERVTWPAQRQYGDACFDYLLVRGLGEVRAELIKGWERLSDHRLVRADLQIRD